MVAVADSGSFSGAAGVLALTQPAVSRQITNLERRLGLSLFNRLPRGVRPTHAGEVAIDQARTILARVADLEARLGALTGLTTGRVRISAFSSANTSLVPDVVARFTNRYPGIEINLVDVPSTTAIEAIRAGNLDIALLTELDNPPPPTDDGIDLVPLIDDQLFIALPHNHHLARGGPLKLSDLSNETWIEGAHPDCLGELKDLHHAIGTPPHIGYTCDDWNGKQALVAAGLGIMIFPNLAAPTARHDIVLRRPTPPLKPRKIYLALPHKTHRSAPTTAMAKLFITIAKETRTPRPH